MTGDRDLLYAVLTQHLGYADATHVVNAGLEWSERKEKGVSADGCLAERARGLRVTWWTPSQRQRQLGRWRPGGQGQVRRQPADVAQHLLGDGG